ncbi:putative ribosomal protein L33 [Arabidopsis thaliana]|uniref:50S ribosomal protein L33, chloroplastic n=8 Tax=Camelineae TaxID=980083 RepID=A0A5S9Y5R4_ARATH|nr:unnamed protein product [Arabidopsis thaliana]CAD5332087.1 unnamed protein product [Arabidopsis thaliana]
MTVFLLPWSHSRFISAAVSPPCCRLLPSSSEKMGDKRKKTFMFIRLVSAAGTGFFYVKRKSTKGLLEKLEFRKYDPRVNRHVLFTEQKMK